MRTFTQITSALCRSWSWKMAWRDSRSQRMQILLYTASIMVGVAALVAIRSFGENVATAIDQQARSLLGADLVVRSRRAFDPEVEEFFSTIPGEQSNQLAFVTMGFFPKQDSTRLVQIRASEPGFPWYGTIETEPQISITELHETGGALVEQSLMWQFNLDIGDTIQLGGQDLEIRGALKQMPGETVVVSQLAPRVVVRMSDAVQTGLLQFGSAVAHKSSFKYPEGFDDNTIMKDLEGFREKHGISYDNVASRSETLGRRLENLFSFLGLVGFIALLLGGVGVASSVHVYVKSKLTSVAMLRCVGATVAETFSIYILQAIGMGVIGGVGGATLGVTIQHLLPKILGDYLPINLDIFLSPFTILLGIAVGVCCTLLFSLLPLLHVRRVSPLMTLRADLEPSLKEDPARWWVYTLIMLAVMAFAVWSAPNIQVGLGFGGGLFAAFLMLNLLAGGFMWLIRRIVPSSLPYVFRQGLNNLYRPGNQTRTLILCLGLGVFLIMSQFLANRQLVRQIEQSDEGERPNMVLFDIQDDQIEDVREMLSEQGLPLLAEVPIVTMRLESVKGIPVDELRRKKTEDKKNGRKRRGRGMWVFNREYRSTYRDHIKDAEELIGGAFTPQVEPGTELIPVSVETDIAEDLGVVVGDEMVFDVQGIPFTTVVGSIRKVDWYRVEPNFFIVFPTGVLEDAPKMIVAVTRVPSPEQSAALQVAAVKRFPNIALIDLAMVVETLTNVLDKMSFAIRFMALFCVVTGLTVLISSVHNSRNQRLRENALLRTLGASSIQVIWIMVTEYALLGILSAGAGSLMAMAGSWGFCRFVFKVGYEVDWLVIAISISSVVAMTIFVGLLNTLAANRRTPLEILRQVRAG